MQWEPGKEYRTRDGRRARIYATDGAGDFPIHGAVLCGECWSVESWEGRGYVSRHGPANRDLLPPHPPVEVSDGVFEEFILAGGLDAFRGGPWMRNFRRGLAAAIKADIAERDA